MPRAEHRSGHGTSAPGSRAIGERGGSHGTRWTVLGAGTALPWPGRSPSSHLLEWSSGALCHAAFFDLGFGAVSRLASAGIALERIEHVVVSHFHPDHTGDLPALLFAYRLPRYATQPLPVLWGPPGLRDLVARFVAVYGRWIDPGDRLDVREIVPGDTLELPGLRGRVLPALHSEIAYGYRVELHGGPTIAYSGDTDVTEDAVDLARDADLWVVECSFPDDAKVAGHLVPSEVAELAVRARVRRIVLTHLYPECDREGTDVVEAVRRRFSGPVDAARDFWSLSWDR
jgi:ribonuclease BN (tRNA processing enzyme)